MFKLVKQLSCKKTQSGLMTVFLADQAGSLPALIAGSKWFNKLQPIETSVANTSSDSCEQTWRLRIQSRSKDKITCLPRQKRTRYATSCFTQITIAFHGKKYFIDG
jgi:hypothetical protein